MTKKKKIRRGRDDLKKIIGSFKRLFPELEKKLYPE